MGQIALERVQEAKRERFLQRGTGPCALLTMRIPEDSHETGHHERPLQDCLEKQVGQANDAAAKGDVGRVFRCHEETEIPDATDRSKSSMMRTVVFLVDEGQVAVRWRRHWG